MATNTQVKKKSATKKAASLAMKETVGKKGSVGKEGSASVAPPRAVRYCTAAPPRPLELSAKASANPFRARAIIAASNKWANHTVLHYAFFRSGDWAVPDAQATVVRNAFQKWEDLPVGLQFVEVDNLNEAEIRIGYLLTDGSWSYIARDILNIPLNERTMSFGWPLDQDDYGLTTAIHEIGHTLGMPHEHQNPFAGIVWDEEKVYAYLGGPPNNWDRQTTYHNVLQKLDTSQYDGSNWDPNSIMEYEFPAGLIADPLKYRNGIYPPGTISPVDAEWVERWYPAADRGHAIERTLRLNDSVTVSLAAGRQVDYTIWVDDNRKYTIATFGASDTTLTLFEDVDGTPRFLAGDDDSGADRHATISYLLRPGRTYHVRLRLVYQGQQGTVTIMYG
jgi:astacin (peptidase family M12A)